MRFFEPPLVFRIIVIFLLAAPLASCRTVVRGKQEITIGGHSALKNESRQETEAFSLPCFRSVLPEGFDSFSA